MDLFSKIKKSYRSSFLIASILLSLTSCHRPIIGQSQDEIIVECLRKENNFELAKRGLVRIGVGPAYNANLNTITESYQTRKIQFSTVDEARSFFVSVYNDYTKAFKDDKRLKPVTIELQITFIDTRAQPLVPPKIARVRNESGQLHFYSFDVSTGRFMPIAQEPF